MKKLTAKLLLSLLEVAKTLSLEAAAAEVGSSVGLKGCRSPTGQLSAEVLACSTTSVRKEKGRLRG